MPYRVRLPNGGSVTFPDEVSPQQAEQIIRTQLLGGDTGMAAPQPSLFGDSEQQQPLFNAPKPVAPPTTIGGELLEVLKGLPRGAVGLLETAASGAAALLPDEAERELRGEITEFFQPAREALAPAAGYEESIGARAGEALGSTLPFLAAGPFGLAGRAAATGLGVAAGAGEARLRAEQEGGMEDRGTATALGALVGATEVIPIFRILGRLPEKEVMGVLDYVKRAAAAGGEEFAQEASANVAQNLIAKGLYKPDQEVFEGAAEEGAYGFGVGAFIQGLTDLAMGRRVRGATAPLGGEDERAGISTEQIVEGAGAGGVELPVSRVGAAGPDIEGLGTRGMGVPREPTGRLDEGAEALQPALEGARFQIDEEAPRPWYYSELKRQTENAPIKSAPAGQWLGTLKSKGVKDEEVELTGLKDWLDVQEGNVSKEDVLNFVNQNGVQMDEVTFGGDLPYQVKMDGDLVESFATREAAEEFVDGQISEFIAGVDFNEILPAGMEQYTPEANTYTQNFLQNYRNSYRIDSDESKPPTIGPARYRANKHPYGNNYREFLISIPQIPRTEKEIEKLESNFNKLGEEAINLRLKRDEVINEGQYGNFSQETLDNLTNAISEINDQRIALNDKIQDLRDKSTFTEPHWGSQYGKNVIGHVRTSDINQGKDLLVHEMQSQLAQTGGEEGFVGEETTPRVVEYRRQKDELTNNKQEIDSKIVKIDDNNSEGNSLLRLINGQINEILDSAIKNNVTAKFFDYDPSSEPGAPEYLTVKTASGQYVAFETRALSGEKITPENARKGIRVMRGNDWRWGDQDGGEGNIGIITDDYPIEGWVEVKWEESGRSNLYRAGDEDAFDLVSAEPARQTEPSLPYLTREEFNELLTSPFIQRYSKDSLNRFNQSAGQIGKHYRYLEEESDRILRNLGLQKQEIIEQLNKLDETYEDIADKNFKTPKFPFSASTDKWQNLLLKRIFKYAVDNGYEKVLFTQGQEAQSYTRGRLRGQEYFYDIISPKNVKNFVNKYKGKITFSKAKSPWELQSKVFAAIDKELETNPSLADKLLRNLNEIAGRSRATKIKNAKIRLLERLRGTNEELNISDVQYHRENFFRDLNDGDYGIGNAGTPEAENTKKALEEFADAVETYMRESAPYYSRALTTQDEPITYQTRTVVEITPEMRSKLYEPLPLFRMGKKPVRTPMSASAVQKVVNDLSKGWANKPNIKVVATYKDLPKPYRLDKYKNVRGMLLGNDVYIVAANAGSPSDVKATLFHESLGHYGLRDLFRTRFDEVLNDIYLNNTAVKSATDQWLRKYPQVYQGRDRLARAVEEVLAAKSEKGVIKEPGIRAAFNRLAAMIRKFLRAMGFVTEYSNNDINNILLEAAERVRSQPGPIFNTSASPRFQQNQYNSTLASVITQNQRLPEWSQSVGEGVANAMSKMPENLRKTQFYIYSMPQVIELLEKYAPRIRAIDRYIGYRASYTTSLMKEASENHAKYTKVVREYPDKYEEFKNVVNDINLFQVQVREQSVIDLLSQPRASLNAQKQKYYDVAKRFYDLPAPMQDAILSSNGESGVFADYRKMGDKKFDIFAQVYGGQLGMGFVRNLRERFNRERLPMYAPLVRGEGQHWLYYETTDGRSYKKNFPTQAAREVAIKKAIDEGLAVPKTITRATRAAELREKGPPPSGFLGEVVESLEAKLPSTMPEAERKQIIDGVYETFLNFMPSNMLRQELSTRETFDVDGVRQFGVLGFDQDALAVYERTMPKMAYQLGNLKFALPIENAMKKAMEQAKLYEIAYRENNLPTRLQGRKVMTPKSVFDGIEDMRRRVNFAYNPSYAPWVNALATGNYIYSIAGNISSALINTTVLPMMTFPSLVARYGVIKTSAAMARASKMFAEGGVDDQGNFTFGNSATGEIKTFFDYLTKRGVVGIAAEQELRQAQRASVSGYENTLDKINFVMGYVFKNSERFNREVTMLSSFMLAREKGKSFKAAAEEAIRLNNNINGTVLPESASRLYQTNLGRVILTFRTFALTQIINLSRAFGQALNIVDASPEDRATARKQLLGVYGMTYMVAGLKGLPLFSAAEVLAAALMGDDDEPYDLQQEVLDSMGLLGLNGPLNAAFNVDIASRTGFNGMLWRDDPKRLADIGFPLYAAERILGPSYGLIQAQLRGVEKIAAGDIQRGFESILPAPLRNPLKAVRYATEGALTKDGFPIVDDVNSWNSVMQIFGFAPAELAATQEQIGAKFAISDKLRSRRTALLTNLYTAMTAGDSDAMQKAFEDITKFNATNPMIGINPKSIQASFRERNRRAIETINGIYLPRNLLFTTEEYMADLT